MDRRRFLGTATALGTTVLAGCGGSTDGGSGDGGGGGGTGGDGGGGGGSDGDATGTFRLLVSDRPADIGDFDSLGVTFDEARVFEAAATGTETAATDTATNTTTASETDETETDDDGETEEDERDDEGGFTVFELDDPTVDLTEVVGERAIGVLDGKLEPGRYAKIELSVSDVAGVVDGDDVEVKVPSEKLQLVKPFEVTAGETTSFVFDINVVKKGKNGYNLLPVISESGVAGEDVDVEEVGDETGTAETEAGADNASANQSQA
ncbi:DUF4382 domain-containing protein [Haloarcula litorea]|uniref:DUF4382 domain-containing protein n=1 Tax=Haloarcula litorea TaxID=3032579 RepID=UPI0023E76A27|nr:DUF4382 domain-containing protein [Halomicroarcula sp. GDY20]